MPFTECIGQKKSIFWLESWHRKNLGWQFIAFQLTLLSCFFCCFHSCSVKCWEEWLSLRDAFSSTCPTWSCFSFLRVVKHIFSGINLIDMLCICITFYIPYACQTLRKIEGNLFPGALAIDVWESKCGCWESDPHPLQEQQALLTTQLSFMIPDLLICLNIYLGYYRCWIFF